MIVQAFQQTHHLPGRFGIDGVDVMDKGKERDGVICYGAVGVGDTKMKVHKAAVARLFESNDQVLDAEQIYALAQTL